MRNVEKFKRTIYGVSLFATVLSYVLIFPAQKALYAKYPEQKAEWWIAPLVVITFSLGMWFFVRIWSPFVIQFLRKRVNPKFIGRGGWEFEFIMLSFENIPPLLVLVVHTLLVIFCLSWVFFP